MAGIGQHPFNNGYGYLAASDYFTDDCLADGYFTDDYFANDYLFEDSEKELEDYYFRNLWPGDTAKPSDWDSECEEIKSDGSLDSSEDGASSDSSDDREHKIKSADAIIEHKVKVTMKTEDEVRSLEEHEYRLQEEPLYRECFEPDTVYKQRYELIEDALRLRNEHEFRLQWEPSYKQQRKQRTLEDTRRIEDEYYFRLLHEDSEHVECWYTKASLSVFLSTM